ncbi:MAG: hypothetical protein GTN81_08920 [Proteobacteria bacterium]|nr:hypothetical protein [Pseudomonadota bacterium]
MFGLGLSELIIIGIIVLLIFGARRLPEIGQGLGKTFKEIKNVSKGPKDEKEDKNEEPAEGKEPPNDRPDSSSRSASLKNEIENLPGVEEIKTVKETASQVRKWWRFLKH